MMGGNHSAGSRLSTEIFVVPLAGDRALVFSPLQRAAFLANAEAIRLLQRLSRGESVGEDVGWVEFLRGLEIVDGPPDAPPERGPAGPPRPTAVTLFLTTACSLRCTYCYAMAGDTRVRSMGIDVARRGIDFVLGNAVAAGKTQIDVAYHGGGEPTSNWSTLTNSLAHARQSAAPFGIAVSSTLASNAFLTDGRIDWILANVDFCTFSFDGVPEVNDRQRPTAAGGQSSSQVMHTLRRFDAAGSSYALRMTVTAAAIPRLVDSVAFVCREFRPTAIQVEPAYPIGRYRDEPSAETSAFLAAFREAAVVARRAGHELRFSGVRAGAVTNHFCGVTRDGFALSPDGNVSSCYEVFDETLPHAETFFYGRSQGSGFEFDQERLEGLRARTVDRRPFCAGCFAKWSCAGDCHHRGMPQPGREFAGSDRCHLIRELTKDRLLELIATAGGVFWHPPRELSTPSATAAGA